MHSKRVAGERIVKGAIMATIASIYGMTMFVVQLAFAGTAMAGALSVAMTRDDAFEVADRQGKWIWFGLLILSAFMMMLRLPFLAWIGIIITGLYWFDVRPQLKDILSGNYGW